MNSKTFVFYLIILAPFLIWSGFFMPSTLPPESSLTIKSDPLFEKNSYYVSITGNDRNSGRKNAPFVSIKKGLNSALPGDTVYIREGTYYEEIDFPTNGKKNNPIVLMQYKKEKVIIDGQNKIPNCISITDKKYISIKGLQLQNATLNNVSIYGGQHIHLTEISSLLPIDKYSTAKNFRIYSTPRNWSKNITIRNSSTLGGQYGVLIREEVDSLAIIEGRFSKANIDGINMQIESNITDTSKYNRNILIDHVELDNNARQGIVTMKLDRSTFRNIHAHHNGATGIQIEDLTSNTLIEDFICDNNSLYYSYETGLWIDDSNNITVRRGILKENQTGFRVTRSKGILAHHLIIHNNQDGLPSGMINSSGVDFADSNVKIYNSVIDHNGDISSQLGNVSLKGAGNYTIKNNIIANSLAPIDIRRSGSFKLDSDYNLIFNNKRAVKIINCPSWPPVWTNVTTWQLYRYVTSTEAHSLHSDPQFTASDNFNLQPSSPAINAGVEVGLSTDFNQKNIIDRPDIGPFEFQYSN